MKNLSFFLAFLFLLCFLTACGSTAQGTDTNHVSEDSAPDEGSVSVTENPISAADEPSPEVREPDVEFKYFPDFTVETADGGTYTLSEELKDHELVIINFFATWCGPCMNEFPYLQQAWSQRSDQISLIALSIEPTDNLNVLSSYAAQLGLGFPIANADGVDLSEFSISVIPTSVLIDQSGRVVSLEVGAKSSVDEFLDLFDSYTGDDYDPNVCRYEINLYDDSTWGPVAGITFSFCTEYGCSTVTTGENGVAVFLGPPAKYHVEAINLPEGAKLLNNEEFDTEPYSQVFWIAVKGA